jgi:hypothetical protein
MMHDIQRQTEFIRKRVATEAEIRSAEAIGKSIFKSLPPAQKEQLAQKHIRYLAVRPKAAHPAPPKAEAGEGPPKKLEPAPTSAVDLMIYDTQSGAVVNKYVYTLTHEPAARSSVKLEEYETLYVRN